MNLKLLLVLIVLFLPACSGRIIKDDSPANDLLALKANAERNLRPRLLPNGKLYCVELTKTEGQQDECAGDLEDDLVPVLGNKDAAGRPIPFHASDG